MKRNESIPETAQPLSRVEWSQLTARIPELKRLHHAMLEKLRGELRTRVLERREVLFYEDEVSTNVYLLLRGVATLSYLDPRDRQVLIAVVTPGEIIGDTPFLPDQLRGHLRCEAFRQCMVGIIDYRRLVEILFDTSFSQCSEGMSLLLGPWCERAAQAALTRGQPLRDRLLTVLIGLAQRLGVPDRRGVILDLPITHSELADLVGASRPKVTAHLAALEEEGLILRQARRILLNRKLSPFNAN